MVLIGFLHSCLLFSILCADTLSFATNPGLRSSDHPSWTFLSLQVHLHRQCFPELSFPQGCSSAPGAPSTSWRQLASSYLKTQSFPPELWFSSWTILLWSDVAIIPRPHIWTSFLSSLFPYPCTPRQSTFGLWIPRSYLLALRLKLLMETNRNSLKVNHVRGVCCKATADNSKAPRGDDRSQHDDCDWN